MKRTNTIWFSTASLLSFEPGGGGTFHSFMAISLEKEQMNQHDLVLVPLPSSLNYSAIQLFNYSFTHSFLRLDVWSSDRFLFCLHER